LFHPFFVPTGLHLVQDPNPGILDGHLIEVPPQLLGAVAPLRVAVAVGGGERGHEARLLGHGDEEGELRLLRLAHAGDAPRHDPAVRPHELRQDEHVRVLQVEVEGAQRAYLFLSQLVGDDFSLSRRGDIVGLDDELVPLHLFGDLLEPQGGGRGEGCLLMPNQGLAKSTPQNL